MTKIKLIYFKLILASLFCLESCSSGKDSERNDKDNLNTQNNADEQIRIAFVGQWLGQGNREKLLREFVKEYNFQNQNIKINLVFPEEIVGNDRGNEKIGTWTKEQFKAEKSEFDIVMINNVSNLVREDPEWAKKYLVDFSEIKEFRENTLPELLTDSIKNIWGGIIPGPFIEGYYYALWCNINVAKKVGIEVKQFDMTFDDFLEYIKSVNNYNKLHKDDYIIPLFEAGDWKTMMNLLNQLYVSLLDDDNEYFKDNVSEKKLTAWYQTLKALEKLSLYEPLCPQWDTMVWNNNYHLILEDKCLFFSNGSWMYNQWQNKNKNFTNYVMPAEYPVFKTANIYPGGYQIMWAVPKNAPHKDEAIKILLALNKPKVAEKWIRYTKCPTGIKGKLASVNIGVDKFEDFTYQIEEKYRMKKISFSASQHVFGLKYKWNNNYAFDVLQGKMTPEEAMERIRGTLKKLEVKIEE